MAPKKTSGSKDELNRIALANGYYWGLQTITKDYEVTNDEFKRMKSGLAKHILVKIKEAKKEIAQLQASVLRLEHAAQAATQVSASEAESRTVFGPAVDRLMQEMRTFDGWTISLLESDISLLQTVDNPTTAGIRITGLQKSFAQLWDLRIPGRAPYKNYPGVFDMTFFLP